MLDNAGCAILIQQVGTRMRATATAAGLALLLAAPVAQAQRNGHMGGRIGAQGSFGAQRFHSTSRAARGFFRQGPLPTRHIPDRDFFWPGGRSFRGFQPGFGFSVGFPVFGLGFDAHHFSVLHRPVFTHIPVVSPFFSPITSVVSSTVVVVVVPQVVPVEVPVPVAVREPVEERWVRTSEPEVPLAERLVGTPRAEERITVVRPSLPGEPPPMPRLTLLVFKDHSIYAVTDYWLEAGQLRYLTSYGARNAVPFEQIDLEMTVQLNWERNVPFVLRPKPAAP